MYCGSKSCSEGYGRSSYPSPSYPGSGQDPGRYSFTESRDYIPKSSSKPPLVDLGKFPI